MNISQAISKRIILLCYEKNITIYELSKRSGVPKTTIKDIISGRSKNPSILSIEKLTIGFSISIGEFWNHEIFSYR
ncbi:helix-turn-helix transcriptional regulator [Lachnoanaerobaculum gingivalis]|uniref:helix-turn-helix domain-containing protein n=1 Tax=Lachnoanaerobaculum gingivalis TaxID=2490855 RepID=UPI0028D67923|nr:helix-turn-helix transcriptional regulator [Lachnoanaerobaculum gingivalis]